MDRDRPLDADVRIPIGDAALGLVGVVVRLLVEDVRNVAEHAEAVRETDRAVEHVEVLVSQLEALPLAVAGRAPAQVDDDVADRTASAADELGSAGADLEVHPADDLRAGA